MRDVPTTAGSKILEGWRPPYDAHIVERMREAGIVILGKTNMDEFAMGSSTEHSAYGPTHNPWDLDRTPGRLRRRLERGGGVVRSSARHRHRHRRLDPAARSGHRHRRRQTDVRRRVPLRADRVLVVAGPGRSVRAHRARRGAAACGHRRSRPRATPRASTRRCPTSSPRQGTATSAA